MSFRKISGIAAFIFTVSLVAVYFAFYTKPLTGTNPVKSVLPEVIRPANDYGAIPLHFEPNIGQADESIKYLSRGKGYSLLLSANEATLQLNNSKFKDKNHASESLKMRIVGANREAIIRSENELEGKTNYIVGNNPNDWKTDVANYSKIRYAQIYDGVDLIYYGNQRNLEYDFVVQPNVSTENIELEFSGAKNVELADNGELVFKFADGELRQHKPIAYQEINGERRAVEASYYLAKAEDQKPKTENQTIKFQIGEYDSSNPLIIDPVLSYSTFLGGAFFDGSRNGTDVGQSIAVDASGSAYITGFTQTLNDFPLANAFLSQNTSNASAFVTKINASGTAFVYSTYLNSTTTQFAGNTYGSSIAVDTLGKAYIAGTTGGCGFPTTAGAYLPANPPPGNGPGCGNGTAGFVAKLNAAGNALEYATYLASPTTFRFDGNGCCGDVRGIAVDSSGNAYVVGYTNETTFPTTAGAFHNAPTDPNAGKDAFVLKLNASGSGLVFSTFLGASSALPADIFAAQSVQAFSIALDAANQPVITGNTNSTTLPTAGAIQPTYGGFLDGFVTKLNANGTGLIYSTYLGGNGRDGEPANVAVDASGNAYVALYSESVNFPVTPNSFRPHPDGAHGGNNALVKLNASGNLVYSTYIGADSGSDFRVFDVAADANGNAYVIGTGGGDTIYPVNSTPPTQHTNFVVKFNPSGTGLGYGFYLNGAGANNSFAFSRAIAVDSGGNAFITGNTTDTTFPTTAGAPQTINRGGGGGFDTDGDAFISKLSVTGTECPAIVINPQPIRLAVRNQNYNQQLTVTGGTAPYAFSLFPGIPFNNPPAGISLSSAGLLSGVVQNNAQNAKISIRVADANGCVGVRPYQVKVFSGLRAFDFDGDFRADIAVFRPSNGAWYRLNSQTNNSFSGVQFGASGDIPSAGDFDGDGKFDISVFRPSNGTWYRLNSLDGTFAAVAFGQTGDVPVPSDYDGDGKSDIAVFRPSSGAWYIQQSQNGFTGVTFGANGDVPVGGDFDRDGRTDICVFRPSTGFWYRLNSSNGAFVAVSFGQNGDVPVRGDFDGDGFSDIAVFRPSTGTWYLNRSQQGFTGISFGQSGDVPVSSDYDADSVTDIAIFRPSTGAWYIQRSFNGFIGVSFGTNGDIPIPALP